MRDGDWSAQRSTEYRTKFKLIYLKIRRTSCRVIGIAEMATIWQMGESCLVLLVFDGVSGWIMHEMLNCTAPAGVTAHTDMCVVLADLLIEVGRRSYLPTHPLLHVPASTHPNAFQLWSQVTKRTKGQVLLVGYVADPFTPLARYIHLRLPHIKRMAIPGMYDGSFPQPYKSCNVLSPLWILALLGKSSDPSISLFSLSHIVEYTRQKEEQILDT